MKNVYGYIYKIENFEDFLWSDDGSICYQLDTAYNIYNYGGEDDETF